MQKPAWVTSQSPHARRLQDISQLLPKVGWVQACGLLKALAQEALQAGDHDVAASAGIFVAAHYSSNGAYEEAEQAIAQALQLLPAVTDSMVRARVLHQQVLLADRWGRPAEVIRLVQRHFQAVETNVANADIPARFRIAMLNCLANSQLMVGQHATAVDTLAQAWHLTLPLLQEEPFTATQLRLDTAMVLNLAIMWTHPVFGQRVSPVEVGAPWHLQAQQLLRDCTADQGHWFREFASDIADLVTPWKAINRLWRCLGLDVATDSFDDLSEVKLKPRSILRRMASYCDATVMLLLQKPGDGLRALRLAEWTIEGDGSLLDAEHHYLMSSLWARFGNDRQALEAYQRHARTVYALQSSVTPLLVSAPLTRQANHREADPRSARPKRRPPHLDEAIRLIRRTRCVDISLTDLARLVGVTDRTLRRDFQQFEGTSPLAFLQQVRLEALHAHLLCGNWEEVELRDLALRYGFSHLGRMTKAYREAFGQGPRDTLRQARSSMVATEQLARSAKPQR